MSLWCHPFDTAAACTKWFALVQTRNQVFPGLLGEMPTCTNTVVDVPGLVGKSTLETSQF